jgi:hypothetical protein
MSELLDLFQPLKDIQDKLNLSSWPRRTGHRNASAITTCMKKPVESALGHVCRQFLTYHGQRQPEQLGRQLEQPARKKLNFINLLLSGIVNVK